MVAGDNQMSWRTQHTDGGTIFVTTGGPHDTEHAGKDLVPSITLAVEQYNRMVRILDKKIPVKVELNVQAQFYDETEPNGFNVIADFPGTDLSNELVIVGAHLDSHQSATGATDNAAGVAVMMDAMRILMALGVKPRRTIRIALWGGEEEGLLGSKAYVREHLVENQNVAAYYNMDNGSGRIRGVWLQENLAIAPIFRAWFQPLRDLDVPGTIAPRSVVGSDYACRTGWNTTPAPTTRTWIPSIACSATIWCRLLSSWRRSPITRPCARRNYPGRRAANEVSET
jgi:hypothetical protein